MSAEKNMPAQSIAVSVVIPCYQSRKTIAAVVESILSVFAGQTAQVVLVDDGNSDGTEIVCAALGRSHPKNVTVVRLARNFGEHNAVMAGLRQAAGDYVIVMDDDGQHAAEDALRLYETARLRGLDLVYSQFPKREHSPWRRAGSWFTGESARILLGVPQDLYLSSFKCMNAWLVGEVLRYEGPFPYIDGLALRATNNIGRVDANHRPSGRDRSSYTLTRLVRLWLCMATNFSVLPLRLSSAVGFSMTVLGAVLGVSVIWERLFRQTPPAGWSYLAITTLIFSGVELMLLGIIGEYLGRLFLIANRAPQHVVREISGLLPASTRSEGQHSP